MKISTAVAALLGLTSAFNPAEESTNALKQSCQTVDLEITNAKLNMGCKNFAFQVKCCAGQSTYTFLSNRHCNTLGGWKCQKKLCTYKGAFRTKRVYKCTRTRINWNKVPGKANQVAFGGSKAWSIGVNKEAGGYGIYKWNGTTWQKIPGSAIRIAVDRHSQAWVINKFAMMFHWINQSGGAGYWKHIPGLAWDISANGGKVWAIGTGLQKAGGFAIYERKGNSWAKINGSGVRIAVDGTGTPWIVTKQNTILKYNGKSNWIRYPGKAKDIAAHGTYITIIGMDNAIYRYDYNIKNWVKTNGKGAKSITVGPYGHIMATSSVSKNIFSQGKIQFFKDDDSNSFVEGKTYYLRHETTKKCIDGNGANLYVSPCGKGNPYQRWTIIQKTANEYNLKQVQTKKCISENGSTWGFGPCDNSNKRLVTFKKNIPAGNWSGFYQLSSKSFGGKCLDSNGSAIYNNPCVTTNPWQRWATI